MRCFNFKVRQRAWSLVIIFLMSFWGAVSVVPTVNAQSREAVALCSVKKDVGHEFDRNRARNTWISCDQAATVYLRERLEGESFRRFMNRARRAFYHVTADRAEFLGRPVNRNGEPVAKIEDPNTLTGWPISIPAIPASQWRYDSKAFSIVPVARNAKGWAIYRYTYAQRDLQGTWRRVTAYLRNQ